MACIGPRAAESGGKAWYGGKSGLQTARCALRGDVAAGRMPSPSMSRAVSSCPCSRRN